MIDASDDLQRALHVLSQCNALEQINARHVFDKIAKRYPRYLPRQFLRICQERQNPINFEYFAAFMKSEAELVRTSLGQYAFGFDLNKASKQTHKTQVRMHTTSTTVPDSKMKGNESSTSRKVLTHPCVLCNGLHTLYKCDIFKEKTPRDRKQFAEEKSLCYNCLHGGHSHRQCRSRFLCHVDGCNSAHHTLLHAAFRHQIETDPKIDQKPNVCVNNNQMSTTLSGRTYPVRLGIVPVKVTSAESDVEIVTNAFLDSGCCSCLCTERLLRKLDISSNPINCQTKTAIGTAESSAQTVSFSVQGLNGGMIINLDDVIASPHFPDVEDHVPTPDIVAKCLHLNDISVPLTRDTNVDLVLGKGFLMRYPSIEFIKERDGLPGAEHTVFGWCLGGADQTLRSDTCSVTSMNFLHHDPARFDNFTYHCVRPNLPMCTSCNADFSDISVDPYETQNSVEDERALTTLRDTAKIKNGRFQVGLPWRSDVVKMPYNRDAAVKSLESQRSRFKKDPELFTKYNAKINEYLSRGYAQVVPAELLPPSDRTFYLVHFHTKQQKMRIVFDASRKFSGVSLNSQLLSGPDINSSLVGVLCRFRMYRYPWSADLAQMFSRIQTYPADSDSLRFLWFENNQLDGSIIDHQMTSHIFGSTCSPAIAQFCLRQIVSLNGTSADKPTLDCILKNTYVDDVLHSSDSLEDSISIINQLRALFANYGFNLTKFISGNVEIMSKIPESHRAPNLKNLDLNNSNDERVLGIIWNVRDDSFQVRTKIDVKPMTRRGIASQIAQIFSPFGYLSPFLLPARLVLQEITRLNFDWDTPIEGDHKSKLMKWLNSLPELDNLTFPRCYKPPGFAPTNIQLHNFADASKSGYSACSYLRFEDVSCKVHVSFVRAISRVVPKNAPSIPRLELTACVASVKLSRSILKDIDYHIDSVHYWTDSTAVLQSIRSTSARFNTFVHQRLLKIRALTHSSQWRHVISSENPADIGSRGLMPNQWKRADMWCKGPQFLLKSPESWLGKDVQHIMDSTTNTDFHNLHAMEFTITKNSVNEYLLCFSSFTKLLRSVAWILRLRALLRGKVKGSPKETKLNSGFLTVEELEEATRDIVRVVQIESFPNVAKFLNYSRDSSNIITLDGKNLPKPLAKLIPHACNGVMRVGGRLDQSCLPECSKNPMILPSNHHVTSLIISHFHIDNGHCGTLQVLSLIREKFWVLKGQSAIRKVLNKCMFCQRRRALPGSQYMADLPKCRLTPGKNVFHYTMVDYFGPITCRRNRTELKRYGCIFTCLSTRAVHIEAVDSLETSAFLMAFFKFCDLRGRPAHMFSDNATTFVGAQRELAKCVQALNSKSVTSSLAEKGIQWHFSPSLAPHFNGCVERIVSLSKRVLHALNRNDTFHDNTLPALFYGVSRILNDRPLTPISDDINDLHCLTPNSILLGRIDPSIPTHVFWKADDYSKNWRYVQRKLDLFWERWMKEYLPLLQSRSKWLYPKPNFKVGDLVLLMSENSIPRGKWPKAIVEEVFPDRHGLVRRVKVRTVTGTYERDVRKLCRLELD